MPRVTFLEQRCKGCGFCVEFCPKKIIVLDENMNNLGYHFASIKDMTICNGCAICTLMCPDIIIEVEVP
jgi:2-oxoglutarate ferredoxin oxidoreductase subunit delta